MSSKSYKQRLQTLIDDAPGEDRVWMVLVNKKQEHIITLQCYTFLELWSALGCENYRSHLVVVVLFLVKGFYGKLQHACQGGCTADPQIQQQNYDSLLLTPPHRCCVVESISWYILFVLCLRHIYIYSASTYAWAGPDRQ